MDTRVETREGRQVLTDGAAAMPLPAGYQLVREHEARQARMDNDTVFEMLLALHEIRDIGDEAVKEIADRALNLYEERLAVIEDLRAKAAM